MKAVFADSDYWIAIARPNDQWAAIAKKAKESLGEVFIITTDEVLAEFLAALSKGGEKIRKQVVKMVKAILENPNIRVFPQTRDSFLKGLKFYEDRADKEYSLTDCISMNVMKSESLVDILTHDHHFEQEAFNILMRKS
ncbi:MAG: hypothetical protein A2161_22745 [Candidatus Schekmanbacteria bacterium RBG_13_48_7]|uniref:PIN domain-containing protein n=1 Tax=Candidatus Schekmanbacteria bacterium RBG_13_48_7 TaxID=1817878 RepID=A0A1F7S243_9BACT|nr:MAG: hypothetical protein A2161_22745 [Candidatus Schekmanbacteria bacterium RBG_13_48_7]